MRPVILATLLFGIALAPARAAEKEIKPGAPAHGVPAARAGTKTFKNINVQEFEKLRSAKTNVVLDVRTQREFARGHIPGAIHIDVNAPDFEKKVAALDKNKTYLVNCGAGVRSAKACGKMGELKFLDLYNLEGGLTAWQKAGNKPEK